MLIYEALYLSKKLGRTLFIPKFVPHWTNTPKNATIKFIYPDIYLHLDNIMEVFDIQTDMEFYSKHCPNGSMTLNARFGIQTEHCV